MARSGLLYACCDKFHDPKKLEEEWVYLTYRS